jgi:hypothetical protein
MWLSPLVLWPRVRQPFHSRIAQEAGADMHPHSLSGQEITCPASLEIVIITVCSVVGQ